MSEDRIDYSRLKHRGSTVMNLTGPGTAIRSAFDYGTVMVVIMCVAEVLVQTRIRQHTTKYQLVLERTNFEVTKLSPYSVRVSTGTQSFDIKATKETTDFMNGGGVRDSVSRYSQGTVMMSVLTS